MEGTVLAHTRRKEMKAGGQLSYERSMGFDEKDLDVDERGSGTEGGWVVHRNAAKYKHKAGPRRDKGTLWASLEREKGNTSYHEIALCTTEDVSIKETFCLCLS